MKPLKFPNCHIIDSKINDSFSFSHVFYIQIHLLYVGIASLYGAVEQTQDLLFTMQAF